MEQSKPKDSIESIRKKLEDYEEKGYDVAFEEDWKSMLNSLNEIKIGVYKNKVFSDNEEFSDLKTEDIKYMLIAFYQAEVIQKFQSNRKNLLHYALKFYSEFYKLLDAYHYLSKEQTAQYKAQEKLTEESQEEREKKRTKKPSLDELSQERNAKIEQYKYKKALSEKLKKIEKEKSYEDNREYWEAYLNISIVKMLETMRAINMEVDAIDYLAKTKETQGNNPQEKDISNEKQKGKMEMLVIKSPDDLLKLDPNNKLVKDLNFTTTSSNQNCVECFNMANGLGIKTLEEQIVEMHPEFIRQDVFKNSNPTTMTMDEFADIQMNRMKEEEAKAEEHKQNKSDSDSDKEEVDDKKKKKAREWDDWKDDNPKGSGNRMGK